VPDDERVDEVGGEAEEANHSATNEGREECHNPECQWEAWRLRCSGIYAFLPIAQSVNRKFHPDHPRNPNGPHTHQWAQRALTRSSTAVMEAIEHGGVEALSEYVQGLREDLSAQMLVANRGDLTPSDAIKVNARIQVSKLREQIAAGMGVVTKREGREQSVQPDDPLVKLLERFAPQEIAEELGNGRFAGDAGGGTGRDAAEGGGEVATGEGDS